MPQKGSSRKVSPALSNALSNAITTRAVASAAELQAAINAAQSQGPTVINITTDFVIVNTIVTLPNSDITIRSDAGNHTIVRRFNGTCFEINDRVRLTFEDVTLDNFIGGTFHGTYLYVRSGGSLTMGRGSFLRNNRATSGGFPPPRAEGGSVLSTGTGVFTLDGGIIEYCEAEGASNSAVVAALESGTFIMRSGEIRNNTISSTSTGCGVVFVQSIDSAIGTRPSATLLGGSIHDNAVRINTFKSTIIYGSANADVALQGTDIYNNTFTDRDSLIVIYNNSRLIMDTNPSGQLSRIYDNTTNYALELIDATNQTQELRQGIIRNNNVVSAAMSIAQTSVLYTDFVIEANAIQGRNNENSGAVVIRSGMLTMNNGYIINNTSAIGSSGVLLNNDGGIAVFNMNDGTISGNVAQSGNGGAIYAGNAVGAAVNIRGGLISSNRAVNGGAIFIRNMNPGGASLTIDSSSTIPGAVPTTIIDNEAMNNGGAIFAMGFNSAADFISNGIRINGSSGYVRFNQNRAAWAGSVLDAVYQTFTPNVITPVVINSIPFPNLLNNYDIYYDGVTTAAPVFEVSFNTMGGGPAPGSQFVDASRGIVLQRPVDPAKQCGIFKGWFTEAIRGREWDFDDDTPQADMTLFARWKRQCSGPCFKSFRMNQPRPRRRLCI